MKFEFVPCLCTFYRQRCRLQTGNFVKKILVPVVYLKSDLKCYYCGDFQKSCDTDHGQDGCVKRTDTGHMQRRLLTGV